MISMEYLALLYDAKYIQQREEFLQVTKKVVELESQCLQKHSARGFEICFLRFLSQTLSGRKPADDQWKTTFAILEKFLKTPHITNTLLHSCLTLFSKCVAYFHDKYPEISKEELDFWTKKTSQIHELILTNYLQSITASPSLLHCFSEVSSTIPADLLNQSEDDIFQLVSSHFLIAQFIGYQLLIPVYARSLITLKTEEDTEHSLVPASLEKIFAKSNLKELTFNEQIELTLAWTLMARLFVHQVTIFSFQIPGSIMAKLFFDSSSFSTKSNPVKLSLIGNLSTYFHPFMNHLRQWIDLKQRKAIIFDWQIPKDLILKSSESNLSPISTFVYFKMAQTFPSLIRYWWANELSRTAASQVEE